MENNKYKKIATEIRKDILKAIQSAGSGHPGGSLSGVEIATALYFGEMNIDPQNPKMPNRDKFILSKGHAAPLQYATLAKRGYFDIEDVMTLRKMGSNFQGHPNMDKVPGIEMSTGSLGQGFSVAVGMAIANKIDKSAGRVYALLGDGELQEGLIWEAAMSAAHQKLDNLVAIVDWNGLQIDGKNEDVTNVKPIDDKFVSFGFNVLIIDGHDFDSIFEALETARNTKDRPTAIIAKTSKGKGVSFMCDNPGWHGKAPSDEELKIALAELDSDDISA